MTLYPLALLPQVTVTEGTAQLPFVPGTEPEYGTPEQAIAAWAEQGAAWVHVGRQRPRRHQLRLHRPRHRRARATGLPDRHRGRTAGGDGRQAQPHRHRADRPDLDPERARCARRPAGRRAGHPPPGRPRRGHHARPGRLHAATWCATSPSTTAGATTTGTCSRSSATPTDAQRDRGGRDQEPRRPARICTNWYPTASTGSSSTPRCTTARSCTPRPWLPARIASTCSSGVRPSRDQARGAGVKPIRSL